MSSQYDGNGSAARTAEMAVHHRKQSGRKVSSSSRDQESGRDFKADHHDDVAKSNNFMQKFADARDAPIKWLEDRPKLVKGTVGIVLMILYNAYLIGCIWRYVEYDLEWEWCEELGFLIILTVIFYAGLIYYQVIKRFFGEYLYKAVIEPFSKFVDKLFATDLASAIGYLVVIAAIAAFIIIDSLDSPERLTSGGGILFFLAFGFVFSAHPGHVRWRHVVWGVGLQFLMGLAVLRWDVGQDVFQCLGDKVSIFLGYADEGSEFVFGYLSSQQPLNPFVINITDEPEKTAALQEIATALNTEYDDGFVFSDVFNFKALSVIYFFSFCVSILFYLGTLQWIVLKMGWALSVTVGTTAAESLNAAANIFLGQTEAPLLIRPFLSDMTKSEIHAVMTGGFATIAGTVLAAYISFGIEASQLISASVMAAPGALAYSKLFYPETEKSKTTLDEIKLEKGDEVNLVDAAAQGASNAIMLVLNIAASLVAFLAFVGFLNGIVGYLGYLAGVDDLSFEYLLGKIFIPVAYIIGVPSEDCEEVARLIGIKTIINEFAAYQELGVLVDNGELSPRAEALATFALCGFANPGSIGIQLGGLGGMAPERKSDMAQIIIRAFIAGCIVSLLNACVAGALIDY